MTVDPNIMMDFSKQITAMEDSLRGKTKLTRADGKTVEEYHPKLSERTINSLMFQLKSVLSPNTTFSFFTPEYIQQKGHSLWTKCYFILLNDMYRGLVTKEEMDVILEAIDHATMSAMMRALGGMERDKYMEQANISINTPVGTGNSGPRI